MSLEREIKQKLEDTRTLMLRGAAADYTAYASLVARYRVLEELTNYIAERNAAAEETGDTLDED